MNTDTSPTIRIFILDPFEFIRKGIRVLIENEPGMCVIGEAGKPEEGLPLIAAQYPDIILLDLVAHANIGLDLIPKIYQTCCHTRIILITHDGDEQIYLKAVQMGVFGVFSLTQSPQTLIKAIQKVADGEVWIERAMIAHLVTAMSLSHVPAAVNTEMERITQLSERERQVILLIGQGLKNKQIAMQLHISETTVRHHLTSIFNKLGVSDRLELLVFAYRSGLAKPFQLHQ